MNQVNATLVFGPRSRPCRGTRRVWWIDGDGGNDLNRWRKYGHGHESDECSEFNSRDVDCYGDVDSDRPDHLSISFDRDSNDDRGDDHPLANRDRDGDANPDFNSERNCDRNPVHSREYADGDDLDYR